MENDTEAWSAAEESAIRGDTRSANAMRMVALARVLAAAETAILVGDGETATASLRQLEKYASLMLAQLADGCLPQEQAH